MAARGNAAAAAKRVAELVRLWPTPGFMTGLRAADADFGSNGFTEAVAAQLRAAPELIEAWTGWSADQRWSPSAYIEGTEVGWYDGTRHHVRLHVDRAAAAADFIRRMAAWTARRHVIADGGTTE